VKEKEAFDKVAASFCGQDLSMQGRSNTTNMMVLTKSTAQRTTTVWPTKSQAPAGRTRSDHRLAASSTGTCQRYIE
jgi:hypothetical protein